MIYIFMVVIAALTMIFSVIARKKIAECKTEEERRIVKAKWQLICGLMGAAVIVCAAVIIFSWGI